MKRNSLNNPYTESRTSDSYEEVVDMETGQMSEAKPQTKKYPNAKSVFALFGVYPANWRINKTQLLAAENLFKERGTDQILKALNLVKENRDDKFCPVINSPYDLDSKWAKLIGYKKRQ